MSLPGPIKSIPLLLRIEVKFTQQTVEFHQAKLCVAVLRSPQSLFDLEKPTRRIFDDRLLNLLGKRQQPSTVDSITRNQKIAGDLGRAIQHKFAKSGLNSYSIQLTFQNGKVELSGTVKDADSKKTVISVVKNDKRVTSVISRIKIDPTPKKCGDFVIDDIKERILQFLWRLLR